MAVRSYICPGDVHEISRSTHLARLAADFAKCACCPHREDLGGIALPPRRPRAETPLEPVIQRERIWRPLRHPGGHREILACCSDLASILWEDCTPQIPVNDWDAAEGRTPLGPAVCVGWGESETAQSFAADVIHVIRRNGCRVLSVGVISRPMLDFAVDHLDAAAGVWVEGGGSPAGIGFRVLSPGSMSWSAGGKLDALLARRDGGSSRPSRTAGAVTSFDVSGAYREGVVRHFTGAPDVDLSVTGLGRVTQSVWQAMQDRVHCRLRISAIESRHQNEPGPAVLRSLQEEVVRGRFCGGAVFGDDGRQLWLIDRRDGLLSDRRIAEMLSRELLRESGARELHLVAPEDLMWTSLNVSGTRLFTCGTTEEEIVAAMRGHQAVIGCDGAGRFWLARPAVHCDAMVTLAYLARGLSDDARSGVRFAA